MTFTGVIVRLTLKEGNQVQTELLLRHASKGRTSQFCRLRPMRRYQTPGAKSAVPAISLYSSELW